MRVLRSLIIVGVLLVSISVQAGNTGELVRIKQNYSRMLVPSGEDSFGLLSILSSIQPEKEISDQAVVELHQRYPFDLKKIATYLSSFMETGMWPDINYEDKKRSGWEPKLHAERILELVKLYNSKQTSYYHSPEVEKVIHRAMDYWFTAKPVCLNWWYNQIGIPKTLGTAFILFEEKLTPAEKQKAIAVMENAKFGMTGQNKVWLAGNVMMRALLQNDYELVKMARDTIASEIVTGGAEGIKDDWCFHQHGAQQQFGNYGLSFVAGMSFFSGLFSGTSLAFDDKQLSILSTLIDKGYRWVIWNGMMDVNALGRQLFHHAPVHKALSLAFAASELGGGESEACMAIATALLRDNYPAPALNLLTGHKHFWQSDYTIYRRPSWMASIKMASDRIVGVEMMNGDNMKGYYMADGATYIYKDGKEYLDIFPLWDWRKLPGVTAFEDDAPMPLIKSYQPRNKGTFVGAVSDEKQGMTVMELNRAGVKAHKAWICADDFVLCLGAGIQADSNLVVTTSIEQCHKNGELLSWKKGQWSAVNAKQTVTAEVHRFFHNNTGYIVWGNENEMVAETAERKGSWYDVMQMYRPAEVHGEVTTLYLKHGASPKQATYQYLILPVVDKKNVAAFDLSDIRILRNDTVAQAVYAEKKATCWVAAYQPVQLRVATGLALTIQTPGVYMIRKSGNGQYMISCASPTQCEDVAELELNHKQIRISLPKGKGKGKTASVVAIIR